MTTETARVYRYEDPSPTAWSEFINARDNSLAVLEIDEEMFDYWLEVLPPVYMSKRVKLPNGDLIHADFGFAEGAEYITAFWRMGGRFFCCQTNEMNNRC